MESAIQVIDLRKFYKTFEALKKITFDVKKGSITGFIGRNGAGKTTTIKILMGLLYKDSGRVYINGLEVEGDTHRIRSHIGFMPEDFSLYPQMSGWQILNFNKGFFGNINIKKIKKYAEAFELDLNKKISALSKGMRQMLSIIVAVSTDPGILILDEPASGLDPVMRHAALELLSEECSEDGATVFYSSHILEDVEKIVDSVVMIDQGNILFSGNLDDLKERRKKIIVTFKTNIQEQMLNQIKGVVRVEKNLNSYVLDTFGDTPEILNELKNFGLKSYEVIHLNLDNLFIETVGRVN